MNTARKLICSSLGAVALALSLCATAQPASTDPATSAKASIASKDSAVAKEDQVFLQKLTQGNIAEVEAGKLAQTMATDSRVKAFGQHMAEDHGGALAEINGLATRKNIALPTEPDSKHKKTADKLKTLSGSAFDAAYMKSAGLEDHKATLALLKQMSSSAKDADIRALADKMIPTVERHYQMAQEIGTKF